MARPDYGLDAPGVVRNLALVGVAGLALGGSTALGWWSGTLRFAVSSVRFLLPIGRWGFVWGAGFTAMAAWMIYSSKAGKLRERDRLLDRLHWTGRERVLDVGCGRGLLLIGAAKRLTTGRAVGVDIWQRADLSGNRPEATIANARLEGVADRIDVKTGDMRQLPFDNASFDVVVSMAAIHNLSNAGERAVTIADIARVLRPGGRALIDDIRHGDDYATAFEANGCRILERESAFGSFFWAFVTMGSLQPALLVVEKPGASR